jgi:hypothetical protein
MAQVRYIQWWQSGTNTGTYSHLTELQAFATLGGANLALGATVTLINGTVEGGSLSNITDGNLTTNCTLAEGTGGYTEVQIDLGSVMTVQYLEVTTDGALGYATDMALQIAVSGNGASWTTVYGPANTSTTPVSFMIGPLCFLRGTRIQTPVGYVAIEDLRNGSTVCTDDGGTATVRGVWHARWVADGDPNSMPVCLRRGVRGALRDLWLSGCHGVVTDGGALVPAFHIDGVDRGPHVRIGDVVEYVHVRLDDPSQRVRAEGVACESLQ